MKNLIRICLSLAGILSLTSILGAAPSSTPVFDTLTQTQTGLAQSELSWFGDASNANVKNVLLIKQNNVQMISGFGNPGDGPLWIIKSPMAKSYDFKIALIAGPTAGNLNISVGGDIVSKTRLEPSESIVTLKVPEVFLDEGDNEVQITSKLKDLKIVSIEIGNSFSIKTKISSVPVDPLATPKTKQLMSFLANNYGKHILSGIMDLAWDDKTNMVNKVLKDTGKKPAIQGFDLINYFGDSDKGSGLSQIEEAIAWAKEGGIVTFCWHWRVGQSKEFYTNKTDFRINLDENSPNYKKIIEDIDKAASLLKRLQDADIPVLWRPLHEASGKWFWWGATGGVAYIELYRLMYDRMVNVHGLHNLIWVSNAQDNSWYPGDDVSDIISTDIYAEGDTSSFKDSWKLMQAAPTGTLGKIVALSENGTMPDPDALISDKCPWSWFMVWNDNPYNAKDNFWSGENHNPKAHRIKVFNHPYVWSLDDIKGKIYN